MFFNTSLNQNRLFQILDARVVREGNSEQLQTMAELIKRCLHLNREERPTMKEVAMELETLRKLTENCRINEVSVGPAVALGILGETCSSSYLSSQM